MFQNRMIQITLRIIIIIFIIFFSVYLSLKIVNLIYPFIIASLFAYLINPLVNYLEKYLKFPRFLAVIISILLVLTFFSWLIFLLVSEIINGTNFLADIVPIYFKNFINIGQEYLSHSIIPIYENILLKLNKLNTNNQDTILLNIQAFSDTITSTGTTIITNLLLGFSNFISQLPTTFTVMIIIILATFFISNDWAKYYQLGQKKIPTKVKKIIFIISNQLRNTLLGLIKAQFTLITITFMIVFIGLLFLQVPYALTISIIIGIVDLLPYLGTGIILIPWISYSFIFGSTKFAIALTILYIIILIQRQIMEPKILSSNIGINPLATLFSVFIGYQLFGFLGMILGPIFIVLMNSLYNIGIIQYLEEYIFKNNP